MIRYPAVAGRFYPDTRNALLKQLSTYVKKTDRTRDAIAVVSPHAGYMYSGGVAGQLFSRTIIPKTAIIIGPNHQGRGDPYALIADGEWSTPMGNVKIDSMLARAMIDNCQFVTDNVEAHLYEHSIEVQVPFLQYIREDIEIVPLCIAGYDEDALQYIGKGIAQSVKDTLADVLIVDSTDMSHYIDAELAKKKDDMAIESILKLDEKEMFRRVEESNISMCGHAPTYITLVAAKELGAKQGELIDYTHSGMVTGDDDEVVSYAGIQIR